jgi:hypothetical protein
LAIMAALLRREMREPRSVLQVIPGRSLFRSRASSATSEDKTMPVSKTWRSAWAAAAVAALFVGASLRGASSAVAAPADAVVPAAELGRPAPVKLGAVTLQIVCRGNAVEGEFKPQQATVLWAENWAGSPNSHADAKGFYAQVPAAPGAKRAAKRARAGGGKPGAKQAAAKQKPALTVIMVTLNPEGEDPVLGLDTDLGNVAIRVKDVRLAPPTALLNGEIMVRRLPTATPFAVAPSDNDYPSLTRGRDGTVWAAFVAYTHGGEPDMEAAARHDFRSLVPAGNGDQIRLARFDGRQWSAPMAVTANLLDLWTPSVAVDGAGRVWVAWSQNTGGRWQIYRRAYDPAAGSWAAVEQVTHEPGSQINVVSATDSQGGVWWAWQGRRGKHFQIFLLGSAAGAQPIAVTDQPANHWDPAIAADSHGLVYVAWDSYENGNYDVFLRPFRDGRGEPVLPVANSSDFEARASLAVDRQDRVWIAYERGGANWGKDFGREAPASIGGGMRKKAAKALDLADEAGESADGRGIPLYRSRHVVVKCYAEGRLQQPAAELSKVLAEIRHPTSFARVFCGEGGRVWLLFRHHPLPSGAGETWAGYAISYDGRAWTLPYLLPDSDNLLGNRAAAVPLGPEGLLAVYSSDARLRGANHKERESRRPLKNDLYCAVLRAGGPVSPPQLAADESLARVVAPVHPHEPADIRLLREVRVEAAGKTYQLARGEFHRHTEYTAHRDGDGSLEDMWRYAQDAADMDWMGNADHDNGWGRQYAWWTIQKTCDIYHNPPWFVAPYTYERSNNWPNGHRNVIFARRGIRTLPRGDMEGNPQTGTPDTKMLYAYLKHFNGMCASHTSATNMGTDWRDNDRLAEPVVEIYQGDRNNYECEGAPRGLVFSKATGQWPALAETIHPEGFVWNALAHGYRFGFESSSDHVSTHSSYAVALVAEPGRDAILEAFRARRCYAATDNILLLVRCGRHLMGEEFAEPGKPTFEIRAQGARPIVKLDVVRNNRYVYSAAPRQAAFQMQWTDADPLPPGQVAYYYVRLQQDDTNLAWSSPMWIRHAAK